MRHDFTEQIADERYQIIIEKLGGADNVEDLKEGLREIQQVLFESASAETEPENFLEMWAYGYGVGMLETALTEDGSLDISGFSSVREDNGKFSGSYRKFGELDPMLHIGHYLAASVETNNENATNFFANMRESIQDIRKDLVNELIHTRK